MAGGVGSGEWNSYRKEMEISTDYGVTFQPLPDMPAARDAGCLAIIDEKTIFIAGGHGPYPSGATGRLDDAYILNLETEQWTQKASVPGSDRTVQGVKAVEGWTGRDTCVVYESPSNGKEVYMFLGWDRNNVDVEVRIFNLATEQWRSGK